MQQWNRRQFVKAGLAAAATLGAGRGAAAASEAKGAKVVELFTSQGCSSCPPADAVLAKLVEEGDVIALAYHVDYWDYLGWKDPLASEASTARQYAYARSLDRRGVYTPQAIVNGRTHHVGSREGELREAIAAADVPSVPVRLTLEDGDVRVRIGPSDASGAHAVTAMFFEDESEHAIERGENRGRTITYHHAVRAIRPLAPWTGHSFDQRIAVPASLDAGGVAVLVQSAMGGAPGRIVGAAQMDVREAS